MTQENLILAKKYYYLGRLFSMGTARIDQDKSAAIEYFEKSSQLGFAKATFQLGITYFEGWRNYKPNYEKAFEYFLLSGTDDGDFWVGRCYHYGHGVTQNYEKAIKIYEKLAKRGYTYAMMSLGHMYRGGVGVEKNQELATKYYLMAAEGGNDAGYLHTAVAYKHGFGIEKSEERSEYWFKKWRENGRSEDDLCFYDELAPDEYREAMKLFRTLADQGDVECLRVIRAERG